VELDLSQLLYPVGRFLDDPLHFAGNLLDAGAAAAHVGRDRPQSLDLLADEQQQALAKQIDLALEVVRERAERDAGGRGDAAVGDRGYPLAPDQLERGAKDAVAGVGGGSGSQAAPEYPLGLLFVRTN
jgi:hypothetical protein